MQQRLITNCPACGQDRFSHTGIIIENHELLRCTECGQQINSCSREDFEVAASSFQQSQGTAPSPSDQPRRVKRISKYLSAALKSINTQSQGQLTHLDIGCSDGFTMEVAQSLGFSSMGVETAQAPAENAINKGLNVFHGQLEEKGFSAEEFDLITLFEVIEHIPEPLTLMAEIQRILKKGGCLLITTGNVRSLTAWLLKNDWDYYQFTTHGGHISFFSPSSIRHLGSRVGLETLNITTRRVSLTAQPNSHKLLKYLAELITLPVSATGWGHDMIVLMQRKH